MKKIILMLVMVAVLVGFTFVVNAIEAGEWQIIDDDLVIVGIGNNYYLMWPRPQNCMATNNNATKKWKSTETTELGQPIWSYATYSYIYPDGETSANYPAFAWAEGVDYKGYTDWRLPTKDELMQLYYRRSYIEYTPSGTVYWSGTEFSGPYGWYVKFWDGGPYSGASNKVVPHYVRAVRRGVLSPIPTYSSFTSTETTNFSAEVDLENVTGMTLAVTDKGKIEFAEDYEMNCGSQDYDAHVNIEDSVISVNTSALDQTFNSSATLTFYNVDCGAPYVYYSDTATTRYVILEEGNLCLPPRCENIQCSAGTLTVDVAHFSGYAVNGTANLTIDADDPKFIDELVIFTAEYRNATGLIEGATCTISLPDGDHAMNELVSHIYNYSTTFATAQTVDYNVTCSATGENTVFANDTAVIQAVEIPEFSVLTLGLGLIAVLIGLFVIRRKT